jgi:hypothetical protein
MQKSCKLIVTYFQQLPILIVFYPSIWTWQDHAMAAPFTLLQDPEITLMVERLQERWTALWEKALSEAPNSLMDGLLGGLMTRALNGVRADEGTVWLAGRDGQSLVPVWNNGPDAERFVGRFQLPSAEGITGWVFTGGMAACESEVCFNQKQHRELDRQLGVLTWAMLAVPLRVAGATRGVITAVRLIRLAGMPPMTVPPRTSADFPIGFSPPASFSVDDLATMESTAQVLGRLLDHRLQSWALGFEE